MSHPSEPIYKSIMGGEILALQEAIEKIWKAHLVAMMNGNGAWKRHVEPAIYEAAKLLPPEMRLRSGLPDVEKAKSDLEDLF